MYRSLFFYVIAIVLTWVAVPNVALAVSEDELRQNNVLTLDSINSSNEEKNIMLCYYGWDYESEPDGKCGPTWPLGEETYQFEAGQEITKDWIENHIQDYDGWIYFEYLVLDYVKNDVRIEYNYYRESLADPQATVDLVLDTIEFIKAGGDDANHFNNDEEYEEISPTEMTDKDVEKANILIDKLNEDGVSEEERMETALILEAIEDGRYDFRNEAIVDSNTVPSSASEAETNLFQPVVPFVGFGAIFITGFLIYAHIRKNRL